MKKYRMRTKDKNTKNKRIVKKINYDYDEMKNEERFFVDNYNVIRIIKIPIRSFDELIVFFRKLRWVEFRLIRRDYVYDLTNNIIFNLDFIFNEDDL